MSQFQTTQLHKRSLDLIIAFCLFANKFLYFYFTDISKLALLIDEKINEIFSFYVFFYYFFYYNKLFAVKKKLFQDRPLTVYSSSSCLSPPSAAFLWFLRFTRP